MRRGFQISPKGRRMAGMGSRLIQKKGDDPTMSAKNLTTMTVCAAAVCFSGCGFLNDQLARISDLAQNPWASLVKQHLEVCEGPKEVPAEGSGVSLGVEFPVAKPGQCSRGDRMIIFASVSRPAVHKTALGVSTGQTITVDGVGGAGMRLVASSLTCFKVRQGD